MFYQTKLDENTWVQVESEASGAFTKSDLDVRPDPETAVLKAVEQMEMVARFLAQKMTPAVREYGMDAEIAWSMRIDGNGSVMIGQDVARGQLRCTLTMKAN